ncbi:MAG: hypothetical protein ACOC80_13425 [Petrotogales bacterium]
MIDNKIIVKKPKDVGRLYTKSRFGIPLPGNNLELDLIEGVFLLEEGKIRIFHNKNGMSFQDLVKIAAQKIADFEIKYLIFKDLRKRGYSVTLYAGGEHTVSYQFKQKKRTTQKKNYVSSLYFPKETC